MSPDLVIGVDSSTTATKAIAWDRGGTAVAESRAPIALSNPRPGFFEQDPAEWWTSAAAAIRGVTGQIDPARIAALAISNQRETFALFRRDGSAVRPGTVWLDERSRPQEKSFGQRFGAERLHAISGKPLDVIPCLFRMLWHAEHEPALFAEAEMLADVHGFLSFKLTGEWATSTASADPMGILDMRGMTWSSEILDAAGVDIARLPRLVRPGQVIGEVTDEAAAATGLRRRHPDRRGGRRRAMRRHGREPADARRRLREPRDGRGLGKLRGRLRLRSSLPYRGRDCGSRLHFRDLPAGPERF